ncbi:hypothetical protein M514_23508 [Trichuris suis]|uniref:Uncharacterized protein n=1 Tax=Trichuris suis TaxID=68888 RepID=A0A085N4E4_9BILA|nr:hypothetical protein M514_23508 [Trichuris suis]
MLKTFYLSGQEIVTFLKTKAQNTGDIRDEIWLQDLAFAMGITTQLTDLNLKLQGSSKTPGAPLHR